MEVLIVALGILKLNETFFFYFYVTMSLELLCFETEILQRVFKSHKNPLTKYIPPPRTIFPNENVSLISYTY